jgi:transposase
MRKVFEALRLAFDQGRSQREIATILALSQSTIHEYLGRFRASGLPWPLPPALDEAAAEAQLFVRQAPPRGARPVPDWATLHQELKRKGVTLQLLWMEYKQRTPEGTPCYQYTQFCRHYHAWAGTLEPVLRQVHVAGEKCFVDYAGPTMPVVDRTTGEIREAQIFVAALGASHLIYAEPTWTQTLGDWIGAHVRMLEYYGGAPALIVPDNLRAGVTQACYYEPVLHPTYQDFATHYATAILPTRAFHPRDKAKVETAVQIVEREILAPLRHEVFHSLAELAHAIAFARERVNDRPFQKLAGSRRSVFLATEHAMLRPLPATRYELADWKTAKVNIDYHISVEGHLYSVPYRLVGATVTVRLTATMIEVLHQGTRIAAHRRSAMKGRFTTEPTHRPKAHQRHLEWTPSRLIAWGASIGPGTAALVTGLLARYPHPEQSYRACLGLLSLKQRVDTTRLEAACVRAHAAGTISYRSVKSILATGLDTLPPEPPTHAARHLPATHAHVRGPAYYDPVPPTDPTMDPTTDPTTDPSTDVSLPSPPSQLPQLPLALTESPC